MHRSVALLTDVISRSTADAGLSPASFQACVGCYASHDPRIAAEVARGQAELEKIFEPLDVSE